MFPQQVSKASTIQELSAALRQLERRHESSRAARILSPDAGDGLLSTGLPALDAHLPGGGLRRGALVEWLTEGPGTGVEQLALALVPHALRPDGACLIVDPQREFFYRGALALQLPVEQLILLHPVSLEDAVWAAEQALRCRGVDLVIGWNELFPPGRSADRLFRRLQLAAEEGGVPGVLLRSASVQRQRCWGDVRILLRVEGTRIPPQKAGRRGPGQGPTVPESSSPASGPADSRLFRLTLLHCRGQCAGVSFSLEWPHETGSLRVVPPVGDSGSPGGGSVSSERSTRPA